MKQTSTILAYQMDMMRFTYAHESHLRLTALLFIFALVFLGCEPQEQEVNAIVSQGITAFEQGDLAELMKLATRDFVAYPGKLDRKSVGRRLYMALKKQKEIKVLHPAPEIEINPGEESALVDIPLIVLDSSNACGDLNGLKDDQNKWIEQAEQYSEVLRLELSMTKQGDQWLVSAARFL